jgi:membrane protein involved in colicin uptake
VTKTKAAAKTKATAKTAAKTKASDKTKAAPVSKAKAKAKAKVPGAPSAKVAAAKIAVKKAALNAAAASASKTAPKNKNKQNEVTTAERRRALEADVEAFLKSGQQIEQVPTGVSGQDRFGRSKHIVLGRGKSRG